MSLALHMHPLSSFCHKVMIAFYENGTPFEPHLLNLMDEAGRREFLALWPVGKMPVLVDGTRGRTVPESSLIIEYLDRHYPGETRFLPEDPDLNLAVRHWDRVCDLYLHLNMQKIYLDGLRPQGKGDPYGVDQAKAMVGTVLEMLERQLEGKSWLAGDKFGLADCSAAPPLFYLDRATPIRHRNVAAYLARLRERPSFARVLREAEPFFKDLPVPA